nr:DUF3263 domain-containing protein [Corynebacterium sp. NML130628]
MPTIIGMPEQLSDSDRAILNFEAHAPRAIGAKEEAITTQLGLTPVRYYQKLNLLLDAPSALAEFPQLVRRLQRLRDR